MNKVLSNPFFVYVISFGIVLFVYLFGWSNLYPQLQVPTVIFLLASFIVATTCGVMLRLLKRIEYRHIQVSGRLFSITVFILVGYVLEFLHNGGIPLLMIVKGQPYDYRLFGIPTFHVFLSTFNSFFAVYVFHQLRTQFSFRLLTFFLVNLTPSLLIVNRGMFLIILTGCLFVYLLSLQRIRLRILLYLGVSILVLFFFFGVVGNLRVTNGQSVTSEVILETSLAKRSFMESWIPKEYIWAYLYISSPLANFQHTLKNADPEPRRPVHFLVFEFLPDFISKRVGPVLGIKEDTPPLIVHWLNVSTFYSASFNYVGWAGPILMFLFLIVNGFLYLLLLPKRSKYYVTGLAIFNSLVLFNTFDNMFSFTGLSLQLVYPLLLTFLKIPKIRLAPRATNM